MNKGGDGFNYKYTPAIFTNGYKDTVGAAALKFPPGADRNSFPRNLQKRYWTVGPCWTVTNKANPPTGKWCDCAPSDRDPNIPCKTQNNCSDEACNCVATESDGCKGACSLQAGSGAGDGYIDFCYSSAKEYAKTLKATQPEMKDIQELFKKYDNLSEYANGTPLTLQDGATGQMKFSTQWFQKMGLPTLGLTDN